MNNLISLCMTVAGIIIIKHIFDIIAPDGGIKKYINLIVSITFTLLVITKVLNIDINETINFDLYQYYNDNMTDYTNEYNDVLSDKFAKEIKSDTEKYINDKYRIKADCNVKIETDIHSNLLRISEIAISCNISDDKVKKEIADDVAQRYETEVTIKRER